MQRLPAGPCAERLLPRRAQAAAAARRALAGLSLRPRSASEACARALAPSLASASSGPGSVLTPSSTPRRQPRLGAPGGRLLWRRPGRAALGGLAAGGRRIRVSGRAGRGAQRGGGARGPARALGQRGDPARRGRRAGAAARRRGRGRRRGALPRCDGGAGAASADVPRLTAPLFLVLQARATSARSAEHVRHRAVTHALCSAGPVPSCRWAGGRPAGSRSAPRRWPLCPTAAPAERCGAASAAEARVNGREREKRENAPRRRRRRGAASAAGATSASARRWTGASAWTAGPAWTADPGAHPTAFACGRAPCSAFRNEEAAAGILTHHCRVSFVHP